MQVGKTSSSLSQTEIFNLFSEAEVLSAVIPEINTIPYKMCSPFRQDSNPSFGFFMGNSGHIYYKDFGTGEKGSLLDFLCRYWNCTFNQVFERIYNLMKGKNIDGVTIKQRQIKTFTRKEMDLLTKIQVVIRPWRDYDYAYWKEYGISKQWLKYAEVYPISHKVVTKRENVKDKGKKYIFSADKYAYCFVERKGGNTSLKIYQPYNTKGFKWCSKMDASTIGLWTKIPEYGDRVIICSSLKDALCVSCNLHIPALCLQGEGYDMSDTAINELKRRYKKVFISFDVDKAGKIDGEKLAKRTGFINVVPDLGKEKDFSDYYKSLEDKEQFKQLEQLFN